MGAHGGGAVICGLVGLDDRGVISNDSCTLKIHEYRVYLDKYSEINEKYAVIIAAIVNEIQD